MTEVITINFTYIFAVMYAVAKAAASIWVCKREFQYPIWNKEGVQIERGLHHKAQSFLRNWAINPEWGAFKAVAFAPVFLVTGKRHIHAFMPWRVQKTPPFCQQCNDKGKYYVNSFIEGQHGWQSCECQRETMPESKSDHSCHVCLDQKTIGKNRPCPHCERRLILVRHAQTELNRNKIKNPEYCAGCGIEAELKELVLVGEGTAERWFCRKCLLSKTHLRLGQKFDGAWVNWGQDLVKRHICERCNFSYVHIRHEDNLCEECHKKIFFDTLAKKLATVNENAPQPVKRPRYLYDAFRYLKGDCFCGDPSLKSVEPSSKAWARNCSLRQKQPTELSVGDTIVVKDVNCGHRSAKNAGKNLRILALNLPFAIIERAGETSHTWVEPIDLRGMGIYGKRKRADARRQTIAYQPLLDPTALEVGDTFVLLSVREGVVLNTAEAPEAFSGTDGSFRGEAYRVTKAAHVASKSSSGFCTGKVCIEAEGLSFQSDRRRAGRTSSTGLHRFVCEKLQIIPVNDQYISASRTHFV